MLHTRLAELYLRWPSRGALAESSKGGKTFFTCLSIHCYLVGVPQAYLRWPSRGAPAESSKGEEVSEEEGMAGEGR